MIQDQLTDYISSQIKLGVSRDAIKSALVSAGWVAADVEDTLKKVEGGATGSSPVGAKPAMMAESSVKPADIKTASPQMIRVSDLVSSSSPSGGGSMSSSPQSSMTGSPTVKSSTQFAGKISGNNFEAASAGAGVAMHSGGGGGKMMMITWIVAGVLIIACAGAAWYFYSENAGLASQVSTLTGQSNTVGGQLSTLKSQLDASSTEFAAQISSLTATNASLALNLSFYAAAPGASASSTPVTITGLLSGGAGKAPYVIMTALGAKVFVANSADPMISGELKPLVGTTTVQLAGTYVAGSDEITVTSVTSSTQQ